MALNAALVYFVRLKESICENKPTLIRIPKLCQENVTLSYNVPNCKKVQENITVTDDGEGGILSPVTSDDIWGCDMTISVTEGLKYVSYTKVTIVRKSKNKNVTVFKCSDPEKKKIVAGYGRPYECCDNDTVNILGAACVLHNNECAANNSKLSLKIKTENATLVQSFHQMMHSNIAQLKVNKARAKLRFATKQYQLAKARLNQQKHAEDTINITN